MPPLCSCRQARENRKSPSLRVLLVVAHPLDNAFAKAAAERIRATLERRGIVVDMIDLYADDFDPRLTSAEGRGYFTPPYDSRPVAGTIRRQINEANTIGDFEIGWPMPSRIVEHEQDDAAQARFGLARKGFEQSLEEFLRHAVGNRPEGLAGGR